MNVAVVGPSDKPERYSYQAVKLVVLAENTAEGRGMRGEHGLSFWIESGTQRLLFDTGQGLVLADNAAAMDVDLSSVDAIVLSHGHYDHTGGLAQVLAVARRPLPVYAHPGAMAAKYRSSAAGVRAIVLPETSRQALDTWQPRLVLSASPARIGEGIGTTGEIPRIHPEEVSDERFCLDAGGRVDDPVADDQALMLETAAGIVLLLGCAHAGLINTLDHVRKLTGGAPLAAVVGGTHLRSATPGRLDWTIRELRRFDIARLYPMHCTGFAAIAALWQELPGRVRVAGAGAALEID